MSSEALTSDMREDAPLQQAPATPFHDLDRYIALPRLASLALSPDGRRLVTCVSVLNSAATEYVSALWEVDPAGERPARRITRSSKGESGAAFGRNGELYFTSARPNPEDTAEAAVPALWRLAAAGGEGRMVLSRPGGVAAVRCARDADTVVVEGQVLSGSDGEEDDANLRTARKDKNVSAILHSGYPVRFWDHDLGPGEKRHFVLQEPADGAAAALTVDDEPNGSLRNITDWAGNALLETAAELSPDGTTLVVNVRQPLPRGDARSVLAAVDTATGERRILLESPDTDYSPGPVSPDSRTVVVVCESVSGPETVPSVRLGLLPMAGGELRPLAAGWDRWPHPAAWLPDGSGLLVTADDGGRAPLFCIDADTGSVRQLTHDDAAYTDVVVSPDGRFAYALRSSYLFPPEPVRIDLSSGDTTVLPAPAPRPEPGGRLEEITTTVGADGAQAPIRAWLALPEGASAQDPAPLLLWVHGGPLGSWNAWSWRWCPWLLVAQGYAVLLPDPALSTGYGDDFIRRGWGQWGQAPYMDLMAITDAAVQREDIDDTRIAAMGGSFGGYMANWMAGHTDRFRAIVSHASLWALDQFGPTTDVSPYWEREMTPEMALENSPHLHVQNINTPMLVVHGDKDYRVPIGEGLRLWYELLSRSQLAAGADGETPHRFLYFPDENHWVLSPQHAKIWYSVVCNFLARHVLEQETELPIELGL